MTTADEQIITKKFENVVLGYDSDYPISFILPSRVVRVNVSVKAKVFRIMGSYEDVGYNQEIRIENIADSGRFKSVYLDFRAAKGYFVKVMGKNGEPMPNETVKLVLSQRFLEGDFLTKSCVSDADGEVALGALPQVGTVSVNHCDINYSFDTCMTDSLQDSQHMSDTYQIVIGESLKLPNLGQPLRRFWFYSYNPNNNSLIADLSSTCLQIQKGSKFLEITPKEPGHYTLKIKTESLETKTISIVVSGGDRWPHDQNYIAENLCLTKMLDENQLLVLEEFSLEKNKLKLKVNSNNLKNVRVHLMVSNFFNRNLRKLVDKAKTNCPSYDFETIQIPKKQNSYFNEGTLHDEIKYVIDRRDAATFMGSTLEKPTLLLKRQFNKETTEDQELLEEEADFKDHDLGEVLQKKADKYVAQASNPRNARDASAEMHYGGQSQNFDVGQLDQFLKYGGLVIDNLAVNDSGELGYIFPNASGEGQVSLDNFSNLSIIISDKNSILQKDVLLHSKSKPEKKDLRLKANKDEGKVYDNCRTS